MESNFWMWAHLLKIFKTLIFENLYVIGSTWNMILRTDSRWFCIITITIYVIFDSFAKLNCFKISAPTVLLAYNLGLPSNYTVEITSAKSGECFQWQSSNPQIVHITPVFTSFECSRKAVLSSVAHFMERKFTQVSATVKGQKDKQIHVEVITDNVNRIQLQYLNDKIVLGSSHLILNVIGRDQYAQAFTSINGLEIQWKVKHLPQSEKSFEDSSGTEVIRLLRLDKSQYETPEDENQWEKRGLLSGSVAVEPIQLGAARITANLVFSSRNEEDFILHTQEAYFEVLPNWRIHPSSLIYVLCYASVKVRVEKFLNGNFEGVNFENFKVDIDSHSIIPMLDDMSLFQAKDYGHYTISYENINKGYPNFKIEVIAVPLHRIGLRISNGNFETLEEMKIYEVSLDLFDKENNLIYPSDDLRFSVKFPSKTFHVIYTSPNGTYSVVQTIAPSSGIIRVEYKGVAREKEVVSKKYDISESFNVSVCQRLNIFPPQTLLPVPDGRIFYEVPLVVSGGTGNYVWTLSNYTVAKVIEDKQKKNFLQLQVYGEVDLAITVTDRKNINFLATAKVSVQPPVDIEVYPTVVEAEVGNVLIIPTALFGYENREKNIMRKFDDCSKVEPSIEIIEKFVLSYEKEAKVPEFGKGCMSLQFRCKRSGHSRVNIEYNVKTGENANSTHKTTTVFSCYKPLKPVHPVRVAVLALGTSKEVAFEGGPRKWPLFREGHYSELEASDPELVKIELIKDPVRYNKDLTVFRVTCKALGESTLTFQIGNRPSATVPHPAKDQASIKFICAEPYSVHLKLFRKKSLKEPREENLIKVPFYGEKIFAVDIWVKDATGRKFANISSIHVVWDVSDKAIAQPESYFDFMTHENAVAGYRKLSRNFKEFKMTGEAGSLTVNAKMTNYRKEVLFKEDIQDYKELEEISKSIDLKLISLRDYNPDLFAHPKMDQDEGNCENDFCKS